MVTAILLAAGSSSRLGLPKQLLLYKGRPLLRWTAENLVQSNVDQVIVVLGHKAAEIAQVLNGLPVTLVFNDYYRTGQSSSLKAGLSAYLDRQTKGTDAPSHLQTGHHGVMFALGDQPLVKAETVCLLVEQFNQYGGIVVPEYLGQRGNPVIIEGKYLPELDTITGDTGARQLIDKYAKEVVRVDVDDQGVILDIDTWNDYNKLTQQAKK